MNSVLKNIHIDLGITEQHLILNHLNFCDETPLQSLEVVAIDFEGKPFILQTAAASAWKEMQVQAGSDGIILNPYSGFRSYLHQKRLIEKHLSNDRPLNDILTHIAIPGFSEHHSGRAIDIYAENNSILEEAFENTSAFAWLIENAEKFKFRLSYSITDSILRTDTSGSFVTDISREWRIKVRITDKNTYQRPLVF